MAARAKRARASSPPPSPPRAPQQRAKRAAALPQAHPKETSVAPARAPKTRHDPLWQWAHFAHRIPGPLAAKEAFFNAMRCSTLDYDTPSRGCSLVTPLFFGVGRVSMPLYHHNNNDADADATPGIVFPARIATTHLKEGTHRRAYITSTIVAFFNALESAKVRTWFLALFQPPCQLNDDEFLDLRQAFIWSLIASLVEPAALDAHFAPGERCAISPVKRFAQALFNGLMSFSNALVDASPSHPMLSYTFSPACPWKLSKRGEPLPFFIQLFE
jgi:hypothetical protein